MRLTLWVGVSRACLAATERDIETEVTAFSFFSVSVGICETVVIGNRIMLLRDAESQSAVTANFSAVNDRQSQRPVRRYFEFDVHDEIEKTENRSPNQGPT